jgi:hypothetical protein
MAGPQTLGGWDMSRAEETKEIAFPLDGIPVPKGRGQPFAGQPHEKPSALGPRHRRCGEGRPFVSGIEIADDVEEERCGEAQ